MGLILLNGTAYSGYDEPPCVYSEEEREIGVWIDGKPLYQKTWDFSSSPVALSYGTWTQLLLGNISIDTVVGYRAIRNKYTDMTGSTEFTADYNGTVGAFALKLWENEERSLTYFVMQYTKTTDVPGSGSLTPQGTPTHHYSTDEHVIGTWIDGKPIYERVLHITNPSTNSEIVYQHNIANFNTLVSYEGNAIRADGRSFNIPTLHFTNTEYFITFYSFGDTTCKYYVGSGYSGNSSITNMYLVVRYTKTTD